MSAIYDNWERLVAAAVKKQQLWELFHAQSRSPSILSEASDSSSSFNSNYYLNDPAFDFSIPGSLLESQRVLSKLVLVSDFSPAFDVEDVYLDSAELLGRGTFGSAYKATMKSGPTIVVKILKSASVSEQDFKRHMEFVASVRHENVAPLRAYYSSKDERLMLYDYQGKGSVHSLLHGKTGFNQTRVDWETRLRIAIGAARGIAKIHTQNGGKLVHGNIKSSNIFLDPQLYGCVSDLGLANMIKTVFTPTAWCYAPEIKNTQNVSQASDVFSFGILLLELLTRKSPIHLPGGHKAVDLVKLTSSAKSKEKAAKVFDADLLENPAIREQMVEMLQIGMKCVAKSIKRRPEMYEVVRMLEDISKMDSGNPLTLVEKKLVFIGDVYPSFDLDDMLRASAEVLGKGTFGTSYKAMLEEYTITVKRLRGVNVTRKEFQQHIEVIGGVKHHNVAELRAYHFSKDNKLLIYDYYNQESVSALLHGSARIPLDWETRLKIAVGAARGIAHLHARVGLNLTHGNIKSSNIFIDGQKYGIVSDAGITAVTSAIRKSYLTTPGYCAPEVEDTREVSQASDVYSFGVFLFELLSGKQAQHTTDDGEIVSLVNWVQSVVGNEWTTEVFDVKLLGYQNEEAMEQVLQLAMNCVSNLPELRPRMPDVVKILEEISGVENKSSLEDILESLLPTLTP